MPSPSQQTEYEKPVVRVIYFVEMHFQSGTQYVCSWNSTFTWGGHDWIGLGVIGSISELSFSENIEARGLTFGINTPSSYLALALGAIEEYRGRPILLYMAPLDATYQLVGTPELCWSGVMNSILIDGNGESGSIKLQAENALSALKRRPALRVNATQQHAAYPADTGFDYLTSLIASPQLWLSKRFQQV